MGSLKRISGTLTQSAADTSTSVVRRTGALQSKFEGVLPKYVRLEFDASVMRTVTVAASWDLTVRLFGVSSSVQLTWSYAHMATSSAIIDCVKEWYVPLVFPPLFDEEFELQIVSNGTAIATTVRYVMYYEIHSFTELEMVQWIESY